MLLSTFNINWFLKILFGSIGLLALYAIVIDFPVIVGNEPLDNGFSQLVVTFIETPIFLALVFLGVSFWHEKRKKMYWIISCCTLVLPILFLMILFFLLRLSPMFF